MDFPTAANIRAWTPSTIDYSTLGYPAGDPDPIAEQAAQAASLFAMITGQTYATVVVEQEPLVRRAVAGLLYLQVVQSQEDYLDTLADFDLIQSFSAGSYNETRRSAEDARKARLIVAWPWLSDLLWLLLTPDRYDYWLDRLVDGRETPAWEVTEVDWAPVYDLGHGAFFESYGH